MRMRPQAIFAYIMSPWPLILWTIHWLCKIHKWSKFGRNPSICSNDNTITSYFCIHNEPHDLDLYLMTPKSNQFISSASNIHDLSLAAIHQLVLDRDANPIGWLSVTFTIFVRNKWGSFRNARHRSIIFAQNVHKHPITLTAFRTYHF